jgi:RNA polymerase sigma factor (sigma-70 family)
MVYFSDDALLKGLRSRRTDCIRQLYSEFFPVVTSIVERNTGNRQDSEDIFQDGIIILYEKIISGDVELNCSLKTYFFSICRNLWLQRLERKWRLLYQDKFSKEPFTTAEPFIHLSLDEEKVEKKRLYQEHFVALPEDCQTLLKMFLNKCSYKEIAETLSFKNEAYAKTRKYLCKNMLRKRIMKDPRYQMCIMYEEQSENL